GPSRDLPERAGASSLGRPALVYGDEGRGRETRFDRMLAALQRSDGHPAHVDDARVLADAVEEDPEIVVVTLDIHGDRELLVELDLLQGAGIELLEVQVRLIGQVLDP